MSRYFSDRFSALVPYVPGEQPQDRRYLKLNTNESPFPPSPGVLAAVSEEGARLQLYSDPDARALRAKMAETYGVAPDRVILSNGSDEVLNFAFMAFADEKKPLVFPDITYGFYPVFAELNRIPYTEIPVKDDLSIDPADYIGGGRKTVVIANPNAPTGLFLPLSDIEKIVKANPDGVVIVDEAYVDFGGESAVPLTDKYDNLLVVGTFSKSRSMAGARLGFGIGSPDLIRDLNTVRNSTNPYNVNRMTLAAGVAALSDAAYYRENCKKIEAARETAAKELTALGFTVVPSKANFLFAKHPAIGGKQLYLTLKERGILIRHFDKPRIADFNRITVGTDEQMETLLCAIRKILNEQGGQK
ncbi:MAG: histidinol-phosphate transaminase [Clostridia bacterium]|nr:histidinol-phosphate transaminase [Clostridia bacterium]